MKFARYALVTGGLLVLFYGAWHLVTELPGNLRDLAVWMVAVVVIHDGVVSPLVVALGWIMAATIPPRGRRYVQSALITGALFTIIAIPLIHRKGTQPVSKALLVQNYAGHLAILLGLVAAANLIAYAVSVARDRRTPTGPEPELTGGESPAS